LTVISVGQWVVPGGESISTIFVSVSDVVLSVNNNLVGFSEINLGWSLGLVVSDLSSVLEENLVIILAVISVHQWVVPGGQLVWHRSIFVSISNVVLSVDNQVVELSIVWGNSPLDKTSVSSSKEGELAVII
jgi:hypothetical protein